LKTDRAGFFKGYLLDLLDGIHSAFPDELAEFADRFPELIRPPGAAPTEQLFLEKCRRCGACVKACPFFALKPVFKANEFDDGTPTLRTGESYCRFCHDFPCVKACPTGAISLENEKSLKKIATASVLSDNCLRSSGEPCQTCREKCDEQAKAITCPADSRPPHIDPTACTGCGACAVFCPAYPENAIRLIRQ
jgi:ferredoxin-type protein NapG